MAIWDWSTDASANNAVDSVNIAENCPPGNLNNGLRAIMANIRTAFSATLRTFFASTDLISARQALGAAASGANSDITSLTGLTTPISLQQPFVRYQQSGSVPGSGPSFATIYSGKITLTKPGKIRVDATFSQGYSSTARSTSSRLTVDGQDYGGTATGPVYLPTVTIGDELDFPIGDHLVEFKWQGDDSTVAISNLRLRARGIY